MYRLVCLVLLLSFSFHSSHGDGRAVGSDSDRLQDRKGVFTAWLKAAHDIARKTKDAQANEICKLLREGSVLAAPHNFNGQPAMRSIEDARPGTTKLAVVVLLPDEPMPHSYWQKLRDRQDTSGHYLPDQKCLVLKANIRWSQTWSGIILLHEGNHAGAMIFTPYDWRNEQLFSMAERDTHEFQNRIMVAIGGDAYRKAFEKALQYIRDANPPSKTGDTFPINPAYDPALDEAFGPALSEMEKAARHTHFWIHAAFAYLDEKYGESAMMKKAEYLDRRFYKDTFFRQEK